MDTFIDGCTSRYSCNTCHYAKPERISDITIGDFWGLGNEVSDKEIPEHKNGISCVLPITEKGMQLVEAIRHSLNIYERPVTEAVNGNDQLRAPKAENNEIKRFRTLSHIFSIKRSYQITIWKILLKRTLKRILRK